MLYDLTGSEIESLLNEFRDAGYHTVNFSGYNLMSGIYFYLIEVKSTKGTYKESRRMLLLK